MVCPPLPPAGALEQGESADELEEWLLTWGRLQLAGLRGFPSWEEAVYHTLHRHRKALLSIFSLACKVSGRALVSVPSSFPLPSRAQHSRPVLSLCPPLHLARSPPLDQPTQTPRSHSLTHPPTHPPTRAPPPTDAAGRGEGAARPRAVGRGVGRADQGVRAHDQALHRGAAAAHLRAGASTPPSPFLPSPPPPSVLLAVPVGAHTPSPRAGRRGHRRRRAGGGQRREAGGDARE